MQQTRSTFVGASHAGNYESLHFPFQGDLDGVNFFGTALSDSQVASLYGAGTS